VHNKKIKDLVRGTVVLLLLSIVIQSILLLLFTAEGLGKIYPHFLLAESNEIELGDTNLGEYFKLTDDVKDSDLIILSVDTGVKDSFRLASDYLQFIGKFTDVSSVAMYVKNTRIIGMSNAAVKGDYESFMNARELQRKTNVFSNQIYEFCEKVYSINTMRSPDTKLRMIGIKGYVDLDDIKTLLSADLYTAPGGYSGEHLNILEAETVEEYIEMFELYEDDLRKMLSGRFAYYLELYESIVANTIEEDSAIRYLKRLAPPENGAVFALLPEYLCVEGSPFLEKVEEIYDKVTVTRTVYYDSKTISDGEEMVRNDGPFPDDKIGIRILMKNKLVSFRDYFEKVTNYFSSESLEERTKVIGEAGRRTFFIISGSDAVEYGEKTDDEEKNSPQVAPG